MTALRQVPSILPLESLVLYIATKAVLRSKKVTKAGHGMRPNYWCATLITDSRQSKMCLPNKTLVPHPSKFHYLFLNTYHPPSQKIEKLLIR